MSITTSDSDIQRSDDEEERTENGYSYDVNGELHENGTSASHRTLGRGGNSASLLQLSFPISRVRRLVKSEGDIQWVGVEAGFLIAKATELFLEKMVEDSFERMQDHRQESILYPHLSSLVASSERLEFLSDFVPMKISVPTALSNASISNK